MNGYVYPVSNGAVGAERPRQFEAFELPREDAAPESSLFELDLRAIRSALYRNRILIGVVVALALLIGFAVTLLSTPIYEAEVTVQVDQQASNILGAEEVEPIAAIQDADRFLQTQVDVLKSRSVAERVGESLGLFSDDDFLEAMNVKPVTQPLGTLDLAASRRKVVIETLLENTTVSLPAESRVMEISFFAPHPQLAARVANSFAENFIKSNLERKLGTTSYARTFLRDQLASAKERLEESERSLIEYARGAELIDTNAGATGDATAGGAGSLVTSSLVQMNAALSAATAARIQAQQRWESANQTPAMNLPEVLANPAILGLFQQRAEAMAAYEEERQRRMEDHPAVLQAAAAIEELNQQIAAMANNIKASLRERFQVAGQQEQAIAQGIERLKSDTLDERDRSVRYNILSREVETNRTLYDGLLQRYKEVSAAAGITANNISVVDSASVPVKPVSPRPLINLALAFVAGLGLALLLTLGREHFDDAIRSPEDIERKLGAASLGSVPVVDGNATPKEVLEDPKSDLSESYYALRTALELSSASGMFKSLLFTSSQPGEGKSTSAYAVARDFARGGKRVVLIDGDLRKPSLHRYFDDGSGSGIGDGLSNILAGQKALPEVTRPTGHPNLDFISSGGLPPNPAELLSGSSLTKVIEELANKYELVIVDGPPVMGLADAPLLASKLSATVFVIQANKSHRGQAKLALRRLHASRAHVVGAVLTKFNPRATGYGSDYGYSYSYRYGADKD